MELMLKFEGKTYRVAELRAQLPPELWPSLRLALPCFWKPPLADPIAGFPATLAAWTEHR